MKIKEVSVHFETVVNLGNWENVRLGCGLIATVEEGEDVSKLSEQLYRTAKNEAYKAFVAFKENKTKKLASDPNKAETSEMIKASKAKELTYYDIVKQQKSEELLDEITEETTKKYARDVDPREYN